MHIGLQTNIQSHLILDKEMQVQHQKVTYDQNMASYQHQQGMVIYLMDGTMELQITESDKVDITENTELTAKWIGATYTITFDAGEGTT